MVTGGVPNEGPSQIAVGLFISYVRENIFNSIYYPNIANVNISLPQGYSTLNLADVAEGNIPVLDQQAPNGRDNFVDIQAFVHDFIVYYSNGIYNPYSDLNADGKINFADIQLFVHSYLSYYGAYQTKVTKGVDELNSEQFDGVEGSNPVLSLDGPAVLPSVGSSFNVTLHVDNVTDLWGWGTGMQWDPSVLNLTSINEGPFLASGGSTMFLNSFGDPLIASNGTLQDMGDCLYSTSGVSGNGDLATLTFQVLSNAPSEISLTGSELDSPDVGDGIQVIPSTVTNLPIGVVPMGIFTADQQGTTNTVWSVGPDPNPINSTVAVDVRLDGALNVWGWSIPNITWNPRILQLTAVTEGGFLGDNTAGDPTAIAGNSPSQFDNVNGTIVGGLSEVILGDAWSADSSGVVATLWFNVTGNGIVNINLSGATLYADSNDNVGKSAIEYGASVTVNTPSQYIFSDGFESGDLSQWMWNCGCSVSSAEAHTGTYSAYFPHGNGAYMQNYFSFQSAIDFRFYMGLTSTSGSSGYFQLTRMDPSDWDQISIEMNLATSKLAIMYYSNDMDCCYLYESPAAVNITANTWFCLELAVNATNFTLFYNGAPVLAGTFVDGPTGEFSNAYFQTYSTGTYIPAFYIDDVAVSNTYIGP